MCFLFEQMLKKSKKTSIYFATTLFLCYLCNIIMIGDGHEMMIIY